MKTSLLLSIFLLKLIDEDYYGTDFQTKIFLTYQPVYQRTAITPAKSTTHWPSIMRPMDLLRSTWASPINTHHHRGRLKLAEKIRTKPTTLAQTKGIGLMTTAVVAIQRK